MPRSKQQPLGWKDVKKLTLGQLQHETETVYFILVSISDFVLTYLLIHDGTADGGRVYESNGVAAWFLNHYGFFKGLFAYKLTLMIGVCLIAQVVSLRKPTWGRGLLWLGIAVTGYVCLYSVRLLLVG